MSAWTCSDLAAKAKIALGMGTDLVELRIDRLRSPSFRKIKETLSEFGESAVVTVRPTSEGGGFVGKESERISFVRELAELEPAYFDIELRTLVAHPELRSGKLGRHLIVSWHDMSGTPGVARLREVASRAASYDGLVKLVTLAKRAEDNLATLSLYGGTGKQPIAFCMGDQGVLSRVMAMELGSPIVYASLPGELLAPGQPSLSQTIALRKRLEHA